MKAVKKILKFLAWTLGIVIVLALVLVFTIHWWLGPTVTGFTNKFGPSIVKTDIHLGDFGLNPYEGVFHLGDFQFSNPSGFSEKYAATLGEFRVELYPKTVMSDIIHIKLIRIKDVFFSYCFNNAFTSNITAIQENLGGEEAEKDDAKAPQEEVAKSEDNGKAKKQVKVIIDRFEIESVSAKIGKVSLPLVPNQMVFTDIGKDSGGKTFAEVYDQTIGPIVDTTNSAVENAQKLAALALGGINQGLDFGKQAVDALKVGDIKGVKEAGEGLKNVGKGLKNVGKGLKGIGDDLQDLFK